MGDALGSVPVVHKRLRRSVGDGAPSPAHDAAHDASSDAASDASSSAARIGSFATDFRRSTRLDAAAAGSGGSGSGRKKRPATASSSPHNNTFRNKRMRPVAMPAMTSSGSE